MKGEDKMKTITNANIIKKSQWIVLLAFAAMIGCGEPHQLDNDNGVNIVMNIDEEAYHRAREILAKHPEEVSESVIKDPSPYEPSAPGEIPTQSYENESLETEEIAGHPIPEKDAAAVMEFVDDATLELLSDETSKLSNGILAPKTCTGDGIDKKTNLYFESLSDECLLPKMKAASQLFEVKYAFARCVFEQENPMRDRLVHNMNGNGLAQITNTTMREISARWGRKDNLSVKLKSCLTMNSTREDKYLKAIDNLLVPSGYNKTDIYNEARSNPPTERLNPLYRDDGVCMGLMTMGIKVQEAREHAVQGKVPDAELARRYNGSKYQQRYARAVVKCIENFKTRKNNF